MTNNEKIPAQGGEMPPVERAAITGSGGIDTVRGAKPADNAAQERNTNAAALDRDIAHLIDCSEGGIARVPRETLVRLRALLTSPRAGLPRHVLASLECTAVWLEKGKDPQDAARELRACLAKIDAAPAAPVAEPTPDPLRRRVERLLVELHAEGRLSEGQCAKMLDIPRIDWRELAEFLSPDAQAVAADGAPEDEPSEIEQVIVCLGDDAAQLRDANPDDEMADNMEAAARLLAERPAFDAWLAAEYPDVAAAMKNEFTNPDVVESVDMARAAWNRASKGDALVSSRLAALEEENRELAEFVIAVGGFWGESRSKLVGPLSLAEIIKQAMREQVSTPADHCLRAPTICAGVAAAPAEAREPVGQFDKSLNQIRWRDGLVNADFADRQPFYTYPVGATAEAREPVATFDDGLKVRLDSWTGGRHEAGSFGEVTLRFTDERRTTVRDYRAKDIAPADALEQFQARVQPWMMECFGPTIAADRVERNHRFLEEALELVQSLGCTANEAHQLVDYTFGRPVGEPAQEVGGVMVTLAALCLANTLDIHAAGEAELARISAPAMVENIRAKQAAKPKHSPLPQAVAARAPYEWRDTGPLETDEGGAA
ncbi:hypothetical protein [Burkholderia gladioli]|uniref:hypothetical protein n=1 Tax=Burkholderia gladioli TaxID=28095 RepID=UPI001FC858DB|nr:hypothetical protein [Burkholderia gladioli]